MDEELLLKIYRAKYRKKDKEGNSIASFQTTTFEQFHSWFKQEEYDKGCVYCGITHEQTIALAKLRPKATRGGKRCNRLELDRRNPFQPYDDLDNLAWCCYWCNNAKSNFFNPNEFESIGKAIGAALNKILYESETKK